MKTEQQSFSGNDLKKTNSKTSLAQSQEKCYLRNEPNDVRTLRNRVRGALENADFSNPANVVLLEATARMWHLTK